MSVRFPHHGSSGHEAAPSSGHDAQREVPGPGPVRITPDDVPGQACCCPAKPVVKVVMPPRGSRAHPVDLWLCGHHWRASRAALAEAGAAVYEISQAEMTAGGRREEAPV